jgi:Tol biopolymer transport system component
VFSPHNRLLAFLRFDQGTCSYMAMPVLGGTPWRVGECEPDALSNYFSWKPDGWALLGTFGGGGNAPPNIGLLSLRDGGITNLAYQRGHNDFDLDPRYSPDGSKIAFRRGLRPYSDLYVMSAGGGAVRQLTHLASRIAGFDWAPDSSLIVLSSDHVGEAGLYAVDMSSGELHDLHVTPAAFPSFARDEPLLVYQIPRVRHGLSVVRVDRPDIAPRQVAASTGSDRDPAFSPDSARLAFVSDRSGSQQLWMHDFARGETTILTDLDEARISGLAWSPDSRRLLFVARRNGGGRMVEIDLISGRHRDVAADENVRYADYAGGGQILAVVHREDADVLVRVGDREHGEDELLRGIVFMQADPRSNRVYYTRGDAAGLYRLDADSGQRQLVTGAIALALKDSWRVVDGRIWYLANSLASTPDIRVFDADTGEELASFPLPPSQPGFDRHYLDGGFDVSEDGTRMILGVGVADDTDIGMLRVVRDAHSNGGTSR